MRIPDMVNSLVCARASLALLAKIALTKFTTTNSRARTRGIPSIIRRAIDPMAIMYNTALVPMTNYAQLPRKLYLNRYEAAKQLLLFFTAYIPETFTCYADI